MLSMMYFLPLDGEIFWCEATQHTCLPSIKLLRTVLLFAYLAALFTFLVTSIVASFAAFDAQEAFYRHQQKQQSRRRNGRRKE
jgi:hypothetical protein